MNASRRRFLQQSLGLGAALVLAARAPADAAETLALADGERQGILPFLYEGNPALNQKLSSGLNGRLFTDLSTLDPGAPVTPTAAFYIRTAAPDLVDLNGPWNIPVGGLVSRKTVLTKEQLYAKNVPCGTHLMECSGNGGFARWGMLSAATWRGVPLLALLRETTAFAAGATRVLVGGVGTASFSMMPEDPGSSWIFSFEELETSGAFLATHMNGALLAPDHGFPVRLVVPNWYGCCCIKWVNELRLVDDTAPATRKMRVYAGRTGQPMDASGRPPRLARDYVPSVMDLAAMPIRIEKWKVGQQLIYNVVGIMWGGAGPTERLAISFSPVRDHPDASHPGRMKMDLQPFQPVTRFAAQGLRQTWSFWAHRWQPAAPGRYGILLRATDPALRARRLDRGHYLRIVEVSQE